MVFDLTKAGTFSCVPPMDDVVVALLSVCPTVLDVLFIWLKTVGLSEVTVAVEFSFACELFTDSDVSVAVFTGAKSARQLNSSAEYDVVPVEEGLAL